MVRKLLFILILGIVCVVSVYADTCYNSVSSVPATCTGGSITQDTMSGNCRTIFCGEGSNTVKILACDKPDSGAKQYFEMYRQSATGNVPKVCLGNTCIQNTGYAKSGNYPLCVDTTNNTSNTTSPNNSSTNSTNATQNTCYSRVNDLPASCTGGIITRDEKGGCRTVVCSNGGNSLQTLACDKGGYFEMYRRTQVGGMTFNICLGQTCLGDAGYVKSTNYPICLNNTTSNTTNTSNAASISVDPLFPQNANYVFQCNVSGFVPTRYEWSFSDGTSYVRNGTRSAPYGAPTYEQDNRVINNNIYHTFPGNGTFTATCVGIDGAKTAGASMHVQVSTPIPVGPQTAYGSVTPISGSTYNLKCNNVAYPPDVAWRVTRIEGDIGHTVYDYGPYGSPNQQNIFLNLSSGNYQAACTTRTYEPRYVESYYEDGYIPPSSSFGVSSSGIDMSFVVGESTSSSTCYNKVNDIPASCTGGTITSDVKSGCRTIVCTNGSSSMQVQACDKTGFFEMYKQGQAGTTVTKICLGNACISDNGYAKSTNYPVCT
jgi:hypothetical protein